LREPNIFFHFLSLFDCFSSFFIKTPQKSRHFSSLFNRISHFLTTFYRFLSLFQRISAIFPLHFRANSAHFRNPLLLIQHPKFNIQNFLNQRTSATHKPTIKPAVRHQADTTIIHLPVPIYIRIHYSLFIVFCSPAHLFSEGADTPIPIYRDSFPIWPG